MRYYGNVVRPPSEAWSYILQITYGCSHNKCTFCSTYLDKPFQVRPAKEVLEDIEVARSTIPHTRRIFLADGNALVLSTRQLMPILDALDQALRLDPVHPATLRSMSRALQRVGRHEEAIVRARQATALNPSDWMYQFNLGAAFVEAGRFEEATVHLRRSCEMSESQ